MEEKKDAVVHTPAPAYKRVEPTADMLFGKRGFWRDVCKLQLKPGARPWATVTGYEYFSSADVVGPKAAAKSTPRAATLKEMEELLARGRAQKLEGWGWVVETPPTLDDLLGEQLLDEALEKMETHFYGERVVVKRVDPSVERDLAHEPVPLPARTPFNHFPDLEGWIVESFDGKSTGIAEL